jgi:small subunit ribosomal protein S16
MLKIRLKRTGKKHEPHYRIVVAESSKQRDTKSIAEIGYYNPRTKPSTFEIDKEEAKKWLDNGAQPTDTVAHFLVKEGIMKEIKKGSTQSKGKKKKKAVEESEG